MTIGEKIKHIRLEKHLTQKEPGEKSGGISQQQIGQWETGKANPRIQKIQSQSARSAVKQRPPSRTQRPLRRRNSTMKI